MKVLILLCFLLSGISGLIFEVAWTRMLGLVFGTSSFAIATVLTSFMSGLAIGAFITGRISDKKIYNYLRGYGILEILVGIYGLFTPQIISYLMGQYASFYEQFAPNLYAFSLLRFGILFLVLLPPTALMGSTLPLLCKFLTNRNDQEIGLKIGLLYGINTFGAVLGTVVAGFLLIPFLGVLNTIYAASTISCLAGIVALIISTKVSPSDFMHTEPELTSSSQKESKLPSLEISKGEFTFMLVGFAISGSIALSYEIGWSRVLILILGGAVYSFTTMLATFLFGLALGSIVMARILDHVIKWGKEIFCVLQMLIGITAFSTMHLFQKLPDLYINLVYGFHDNFTLFHLMKCFLAGLIMFLPTLFLGMMFPLMARIHAIKKDIGSSVGDVYSINTFGSIMGSFGMGFLMIPAFGVTASLFICVLGNLFISCFSWFVLKRNYLQSAFLLLVIVMTFAFPPIWDASEMTAGVFRYAPDIVSWRAREQEEKKYLRRKMETTFPKKRTQGLKYYREGLTATVSVHEQDGELIYKTNGKPDASTHVDLATQVLVGHLPILLSPSEPEETLVIGLASGITTGSVACYKEQMLTCVELEEASIDAAKLFSKYNREIIKPGLADGKFTDTPNFDMKIIDARNYLLGTKKQFSVIISEPSNPWMTGVSNLFTKEFFQLCKKKLKPDGILCQWVQLYEISWENLRILLSTLHSEFPHLLIFRIKNDTIILASQQKLEPDWDKIRKRMEIPEVKEDLARLDINHPAQFLTYYFTSTNEASEIFQEKFFNTDDNAYIEFTAPRQIFIDDETLNILVNVQKYSPFGLKSWLAQMPPDEKFDWAIKYLRFLIKKNRIRELKNVAQQLEFFKNSFSGKELGEIAGWAALCSYLAQKDPTPFFEIMQQEAPEFLPGKLWQYEWKLNTTTNYESLLSSIQELELPEKSRVLGLAYYRLKRYKEASQEAEKVYQDRLNWPESQLIEYLNYYGRSLKRQETPNYEKAIEILRESDDNYWKYRGEEGVIKFDNIYTEIAECYFALKELDHAGLYFIRSFNLLQSKSEHYYRQATKTSKEKKYTPAEKEEFLRKASESDPSFYQASFEYWNLIKDKKPAEAKKLFEAMEKRFPWFEEDRTKKK